MWSGQHGRNMLCLKNKCWEQIAYPKVWENKQTIMILCESGLREKWESEMKDFVNWAIQFCFDFLIDNKHQQIVHSHYHLWVHFGNNFYNGVLNKVEVDWNCSPASPTFEMFHPADFKEMSKKILFHLTWFKFAALREIVQMMSNIIITLVEEFVSNVPIGPHQGCISCGILVSGIRARGVSSEHMENMEMFSCSPT